MYCSECGCDRILLQNALNTLLQPEQPAQTEPELLAPLAPQRKSLPALWALRPLAGGADPDGGCNRAGGGTLVAASRGEPAAEQTRVLDARNAGDSSRAGHVAADEGTRVMPAPSRRAADIPEQEPAYDDEEEDEDERDSVAEALIRWVPPITAIVCAAVALCGFVYYQFVL